MCKAVIRRIENALGIFLIAGLCAPVCAGADGKPVPVRGQGCVAAGVDARCLAVRDQRTGKLYNLIFKGIQPPIGEGIEFEALPHKGAVVCVLGAVFDVTAWARKDSLRCKPEPAPKK